MSGWNVVNLKKIFVHCLLFDVHTIFTCVPQGAHHHHTESEVDQEGSPHPADRDVVPRPVLRGEHLQQTQRQELNECQNEECNEGAGATPMVD